MTKVNRIGVVVPTVYPVPELLQSLDALEQFFLSRGYQVFLALVDDTGHSHPYSEYFLQWDSSHVHHCYVVLSGNQGQHPATWAGIRALPMLEHIWIMDDDLSWDQDLPTLLALLMERTEELLYVVPNYYTLADRWKVVLLRVASWLVLGKLPPSRGSSQRLIKGALLERCKLDNSRDPYLDARLWRLARSMNSYQASYHKVPRDRGLLRYTLRSRIRLLWCALTLQLSKGRKILLFICFIMPALVLWLLGVLWIWVFLALAPFMVVAALTLWLEPCIELSYDHPVF